MKYITLSGLIMLFLFFIFSIVYYANSDKTQQQSLGDFWNGITGLAFFEDKDTIGENLAVAAASFTLGVSIVYILLRGINAMIFAERV